MSYNARGRLNKIAFADNVTSLLTYDAAGNLTRSQFSDETDLKFAYDALNRLVETDGVKLAYDAEGRIVNTENAGAAYRATYDDAGRVKTVAYANGAVTVTYIYDAKTGLLTQVADSLTKTQVDFAYDQDRRLVGIARSNKVNMTLTWDKASRLTRIQDVATGGSPVVDAQYTLDAAGQVTSAKMRLPLDPAAALVGQIGNLSYDAASQISSAGYQYDARGRLTQSPNHQFTWDGASRLVGIGQTTLTYNGLGDVVLRSEGNATTTYAYNYALGLAPIVAEVSSPTPPVSPSPTRYYVWTPGGQLLYMIDAADNNKVYHFHFDRTGSTLALTDANGALTDAYAYDPYGKLLAHQGQSAQPFTFAGKWGVRAECRDVACNVSTLYQMRARYYDATTARFLSREPLWPQVGDPRQLNPYQYALNDPVNVVDRNGMTPEQVFAIWLERLTGGQQSSAWQLWLTGEAFTYNEAEAVSFLTVLDELAQTSGERETIYKAMRNVTETVTIPLPPPTRPPEESEPCLPDVREGIHTGNTIVQRVGLVPNTLSGESTIARTVGASKAAWHGTPLRNLTPTSKINVWQGAKLVGRTCTLTAGALSYIEIGMHFTKTPEEISQEAGNNLESWNPFVRGPAELGNLIGNWWYGD